MRVRRLLTVAVVALLPMALVAGPARAGNAYQLNEKYSDEVFADLIPCGDDWYQITVSGRLVESFTVNKNSEHFTFTDTGKFFAEPIRVTEWSDPEDHGDGPHVHPLDWVVIEGATWSGQYAVWGGGNVGANAGNFTFTFTVTGVSSEGDRLSAHFLAHFGFAVPAGELREHAFGQAVCDGEVERF